MKVRAGTIGARTRWGEQPRQVRLDALDLEQRALVHAFVRMAEAVAAKKEASTVSETSVEAESEGHANDRPAA